MIFDTDRQTISDLTIFPGNREIKSVFDFYNRTQTAGGKDVLYSMMSTPLTGLTEINSRLSSIKFIHDYKLFCEFEKKDLIAIEFYLNMDNTVLKDNILDSLFTYLSDRVHPGNEYYQLSRGITCLYKHIKKLIDFFEVDDLPELPEFLAEFKSEVDRVNYHPDFKSYLHRTGKRKNFTQINRFDHLIRKKEKASIKKIIELTYLLDGYISLASVADEKELGFPVFVDSIHPTISIEGFFHPLLNDPVKNDICFTKDQNLCFVSGANMAGKSTFLKTIGLCVYFSHLGFPVPARTMVTSLFNGLYTTINISDNINKGYSHYYSEVKRVKDIAEYIKEKKRVFVIFDELFRGTNVKDAFDATLMITRGFTGVNNSCFFISTHIVEVAKELEKSDKISFKCFESTLQDDQPVYNYKLKEGISSERLGLTILKNEGIMEIIDEITKNEKNVVHKNDTGMITKRTDPEDRDFCELVIELDKDLNIRDGEEHVFYSQYNKTDKIKHVIVVYDHVLPVGCGALKAYFNDTVEIKRMFVNISHRNKGIASEILHALEIWSKELGYKKCILETGKKQPEAIRLYEKNQYVIIPNYGPYVNVENSICFEKEL